MTVHLIHDTEDATRYNAKAYHPMQAWQWGEARKQMGTRVIRLGSSSDVFQMTIHPVPYTPYKIGYLPRSVVPNAEILSFLHGFAQDNGIIFIKMEPYVMKEEAAPIIETEWKSYDMVRSPHLLFPDWTQVLDITPSEETLLAAMKPKTRYNIKLAAKKGVTVKEESDDKGFDTFIRLYFETCRRQKYFGHDRNYHEIIWNHLKTDISHIMTAYYNDTPLGSYELFLFKDTMYYTYGGSSEAHRNVMGPNLLMWESIRLGKRLGAHRFDMWGSLPPEYDQRDPWAGFTRFKEGYGTRFVELAGSYDFVINRKAYGLYGGLHAVRSVYLKIKRMLSS